MDDQGKATMDDIGARACREVKPLLSGALHQDGVDKDHFRTLLETANSGVQTEIARNSVES
jgi:hypothetical protein